MVAVGTVYEIAEERGVKPETIKYYGAPTYQRRSKSEVNNRLQLVKLED